MNATMFPIRYLMAAFTLSGFISSGCEKPRAPVGGLPPAYTSNQITDPALQAVVEEIRNWTSQQEDGNQKPLYNRVEVLPPVPIVQPYGVGVFQQEVRLPVIFTTGAGWVGMTPAAKEEAAAQAFRDISAHLQSLNHEPALQLTLTIQTPEGMELAWINRLDAGGKNVHGDE